MPKTAGTSVAVALSCEHVLRPHRNIVEIREALEPDPNLARCNDECFKFGFVRNPWDRVMSLYCRREGEMLAEQLSFESFVEWIEYASDTCIHPSRHRYQLDWFRDENGDIRIQDGSELAGQSVRIVHGELSPVPRYAGRHGNWIVRDGSAVARMLEI